MKKIRKISALLSAIIMACGTANTATVNVFAAEGSGKFGNPIVFEKNITKFTPHDLDFNGDGKINYLDVIIIESDINNLYEKRHTNYYQQNSDGTYTYKGLAIENDNEKKYDLNGDKELSPADYCNLLYIITSNFRFSKNVSKDTGTELTASITAYKGNKDADKLVIPAEIYDAETGRIYPVTKIDSHAFSYMKNLKEIVFINYRQPNWVDEWGRRISTRGTITASNPLSIENYAFAHCPLLETVVFPENISVKNKSFDNTSPFFKNNNQDYNGVKVLTGSADSDGKTNSVVYEIDFDKAVNDNGNLDIPACVTAISDNIAPSDSDKRLKLKNLNFIRNNGSFNLRYVGTHAFKECDNLATVNYNSFVNLDEYLKNQLYKYSSAFDCTAFMAAETDRQIDKVEKKIKSTPGYDNMNDAEKALIAAKYIVNNVYYTSWYTNADEFSLYPNSLYSTLDVARESYGSEHAGMNVRFTVCVGISKTYSLILDRIGVKNFTMGLPGHATNQVYISKFKDKNGNEAGGKWFKIDLTAWCSARANEVMNSDNRPENISTLREFDDSVDINNSGSEVVSKLTINKEYLNTLNVSNDAYINIMDATNDYDAHLPKEQNFFRLFKASNGKHIDSADDIYFIYNKDNSKLLLYRAGNSIDPEYVEKYAKSMPILNKYIEEGLIGFYDAQKNIQYDYGDYKLTLDTKGKYALLKNDFDNNFVYRDGNSDVATAQWLYVKDVSVRDAGKEFAWFLINDDGKVLLNSKPIAFEMKDNKLYAYDTNHNALNGKYYSCDYFWTFENGILVDSDSYL